MTHLAKHHNSPDFISHILTDNTSPRSQHTINTFKLQTQPMTHLAHKLQTELFKIASSTSWNKLTQSIREINSTITLKN